VLTELPPEGVETIEFCDEIALLRDAYLKAGNTAVSGTVTNDYTDTQSSNDTYESIQEIESGGKPQVWYISKGFGKKVNCFGQ